jgi:hypothetical protein
LSLMRVHRHTSQLLLHQLSVGHSLVPFTSLQCWTSNSLGSPWVCTFRPSVAASQEYCTWDSTFLVVFPFRCTDGGGCLVVCQ